MSEQELRQSVVGIAQGWLGRKESDGSHREIIDLYNSHKPLARGYRVKYTDAWCAAFASAVAIQAGLTGVIPTECGCGGYIEQFKKLGSWEENDAYVPQPADYIFYDWQDGTDYAATDNKGAPDHVGVVEKVSGQTITVIEGNMSGAVGRRTLKVNGRYIRGYGVPKYGGRAEGGSAAPGAKALAAVDKLAKLGVVNSPDYWRQAVTGGKVKYLDILLVKAAEKITKAGPRSSTPETGVAALVSAGVIDTPDYWLANYSTFPSLDALLRALGGAV